MHLCDLKDNRASIHACHITKFDDLLTMSDVFDEFKKVLASGQFDSNVTDKLFICIRLIRQKPSRRLIHDCNYRKGYGRSSSIQLQ